MKPSCSSSRLVYHGELAAPEILLSGSAGALLLPELDRRNTSGAGTFTKTLWARSFGRISQQEAFYYFGLETYLELSGKLSLDERIDFRPISLPPRKTQVQYLKGKIKGKQLLRPFLASLIMQSRRLSGDRSRDIIFISLVRTNEDGQVDSDVWRIVPLRLQGAQNSDCFIMGMPPPYKHPF